MIDHVVKACADELGLPPPVTKGDLVRLIRKMAKKLTVRTRCIGCGWEAKPVNLNVPGDTFSFTLGKCDHCPKTNEEIDPLKRIEDRDLVNPDPAHTKGKRP